MGGEIFGSPEAIWDDVFLGRASNAFENARGARLSCWTTSWQALSSQITKRPQQRRWALRSSEWKGNEMRFDQLKQYIEGTVPWVKDSGLVVELLECRHAVLRMPKDRHLNHVKIVYAGSLFTLMENAGAALFWCTYDFEMYIPIVKEMNIRFLKMGTTDIICGLAISEDDAIDKIRSINERGRGEWILEMSCHDTDGNVVADATCHYYIKKLM
jgi:acyl-coenzyme A thioesterase PaaI-like protein